MSWSNIDDGFMMVSYGLAICWSDVLAEMLMFG
jgi:hypothetical protein